MDKAEYHQRLDELTDLVQDEDYEAAYSIANEIDWRRVKSIRTLNMIADIYERNKDYKGEKNILKIAYSRSSMGRSILSRLVEVCLKIGEVGEAEKYFDDFTKVAKNDNSRCILQYKLYKAKKAPIEAQIAVLEEYREREYTERWAYELALLYSRAGMPDKCVDACDDLILWFSEGKYVLKAMELKMKYQPLGAGQQILYEKEKQEYQKSSQPLVGSAAAAVAPAAVAAGAALAGSESGVANAGEIGGVAENGAPTLPEELTNVSSTPGNFSTENLELAAAGLAAALGNAQAATREAEASIREYEAQKAAEGGILTADGRTWEEESEDELALASADTEAKADAEASAVADDLAIADVTAEDVADAATETEAPKTWEEIDENEEDETADNNGNDKGAWGADALDDADVAEIENADESVQTGDVDIAEADIEEAPASRRGDLKDKLSKGLKDVFSGFSLKNEDDDESGKEILPDESDIEVKELEEEEEIPYESPEPEEPSEGLVGVEVVDENSFNLEEFLKETAGAFSNDIAVGDFESTADEIAEDEETEETEVAPVTLENIEEFSAQLANAVADADAAAGTAASDATSRTDASDSADDIPSYPDDFENGQPEAVDNSAATEAGQNTGAIAAEAPVEEKRVPHYNEELEIPDPEPTEEEKISRTIPLNKIGQNTVPISLDQVLSEETPEERRIRILNKRNPTRMSDDQRKIFTYFARIPGMDSQILEAVSGVYEHAGEKTSVHGNIAVMGAKGTGKTRLTHGLIVAMCQDLGLDAAKVARVSGSEMNRKDPAAVVSQMSGGFMVIENAGRMDEKTVEKLNQAMEFRTDCMVLIIEDEKSSMRNFLKNHPHFAAKFEKVISIPVFTNDELVTFARTYATENGCKIDDMGILALYTLIGNNQTEEEPVTISQVKAMVDSAINHAVRGKKRAKKGDAKKDKWVVLHEKDFEVKA